MRNSVIVEIRGFKYDPMSIEITTGQSVVWKNLDSMAHTATRTVSPAFDTGSIPPGSNSASIEFIDVTPPEGIEYSCKPHPFMKGRIVVKSDSPSR